MIKKMMVTKKEDVGRPLNALEAQIETCLLNKVEASWGNNEILLSMSHMGRPCDSFQLKFNPKSGDFTSIPKEWSRVRVSGGNRSR